MKRAHKAVISYSDYRDQQTELTWDEVEWFESKVALAKRATGCAVDIIPFDHELYRGKSKDALGCCISTNPDNQLGDGVDTYITIDCYFINECYRNEFMGDFLISGQTLLEVIVHEIAHLYVWRHGKKHTALTAEILHKIQCAEEVAA